MRVTPLVLLGWWFALLSPGLSRQPDLALNRAAVAVQSGSQDRQFLILAAAALGAAYLPVAYRHVLQARHSARGRALIATLCTLGVYLAWSALTLFWTVDFGVSVRRLSELVLIVIACVGLGIGFYGRPGGIATLARHVAIGGLVAVAVVVWGAAAGPIRLFDPNWRVQLVGLQTATSLPIAYAAVAGVALFTDPARQLMSTHRGVKACGYAALCFLALFIQKDRVVAAATVLMIMAVLYGIVSRSNRKTFLLLGSTVVLGLILTFSVLLPKVGAEVHTYATRGEDAQTNGSLTGRLPLWRDLLGYLDTRLIEGYGFGAFWNPTTMPIVQAKVGWPAVVAHDGFLDEALATGVIGLFLFLVLWLGALRRCIARVAIHGSTLDRVIVLWLILFLLLNVTQSVLQTFFQPPFFISLTGMLALLAGSSADPEPQLEPVGASPERTRR